MLYNSRARLRYYVVKDYLTKTMQFPLRNKREHFRKESVQLESVRFRAKLVKLFVDCCAVNFTGVRRSHLSVDTFTKNYLFFYCFLGLFIARCKFMEIISCEVSIKNKVNATSSKD